MSLFFFKKNFFPLITVSIDNFTILIQSVCNQQGFISKSSADPNVCPCWSTLPKDILWLFFRPTQHTPKWGSDTDIIVHLKRDNKNDHVDRSETTQKTPQKSPEFLPKKILGSCWKRTRKFHLALISHFLEHRTWTNFCQPSSSSSQGFFSLSPSKKKFLHASWISVMAIRYSISDAGMSLRWNVYPTGQISS